MNPVINLWTVLGEVNSRKILKLAFKEKDDCAVKI